MNNIVIGQFVPGKGFFYKLDPRTKIIAIVLLMVALFLLDNMLYLFIGFALSILILIFGKLSIIRILKGLKPILILLIFTFFFQILFNQGGTLILDQSMALGLYNLLAIVGMTVIWRFLAHYKHFNTLLFLLYIVGILVLLSTLKSGPLFTSFHFTVYEKGIEQSVFVVIRLLIIITLSTVLTITTKPTDLTQGIEKLMRPLKAIGVNSEEFAMIVSISLRYIPTILDEANKIMLAQASRGSDFTEGKLKDKVKQVISLLVPMFIIAFKRSEELADAMESRNFIPGKIRTRIYELKFSHIDLISILFTLACLATSIYLKVI